MIATQLPTPTLFDSGQLIVGFSEVLSLYRFTAEQFTVASIGRSDRDLGIRSCYVSAHFGVGEAQKRQKGSLEYVRELADNRLVPLQSFRWQQQFGGLSNGFKHWCRQQNSAVESNADALGSPDKPMSRHGIAPQSSRGQSYS
jgi:hypothetical protein